MSKSTLSESVHPASVWASAVSRKSTLCGNPRRLLEDLVRLVNGELQDDLPRRAVRVALAGIGPVEGQRPHAVPGQVQPGPHLPAEGDRIGASLERVGPLLERGGWGQLGLAIASHERFVDGLEVLPERAPREAVHDEVVGDDEEARPAGPQVEGRDAEERPVLQVQAPLELAGVALDGGRLLVLGQVGEIVAGVGQGLAGGSDGGGPAVDAVVEAQPQGVVALDEPAHDPAHQLRVDGLGSLQQDAEVPVAGVGRAAFHEEARHVGQDGQGGAAGIIRGLR